MKKIALAVLTTAFAFTACKNSVTSGYDKTPDGLWVKKINITSSPKAKVGDIITVNFDERTQKDSEIISTRKLGKPAPLEVRAPLYKGDVAEGLIMLGAGDSASFLMSIDSMFKKNPGPRPAFLKSGEYIKLNIKVLSVESKEQAEKERADAAAQQASQEGNDIADYIKTNKIKAQQTASGLYYAIDKKGSGPLPKPGQSVTVNYTGSLLNGTVFDSSLKPGRSPFTFVLGQGQVIKGWDEGVALLPVGSKAHLIVPSALGYGPQGNQGIPPNSPLAFEVEVISVK